MIYEILPAGAENAIASDDLCKIAGLSSTRDLQRIIAAERAKGALILSNSKAGYFVPDDGEKGRHEIAEFVTVLRHRAINTLQAIQAARAALESVDGQTEISI